MNEDTLGSRATKTERNRLLSRHPAIQNTETTVKKLIRKKGKRKPFDEGQRPEIPWITNLVQEVHERHLEIALATVTGTGLLQSLAALGDDDIRYSVAADLAETRVDLRHVEPLGTFSQRDEAERLRVPTGVMAEVNDHDTAQDYRFRNQRSYRRK